MYANTYAGTEFSQPRRPAGFPLVWSDQLRYTRTAVPLTSPGPEITVNVPETLRGCHSFVSATRSTLEESKRKDDHGRIEYDYRPGIVAMKVSKEAHHRALRIVQGLFDSAGAEGYEIGKFTDGHHAYKAKPGVGIQIGGFIYPVEIRERTREVIPTDDEIEKWQEDHSAEWERRVYGSRPRKKFEPSGELELISPRGRSRGERYKWDDGKTARLEDKLGTILPALAERVPVDRADKDERKVREEQRAREAAQREADRKQQQIHSARLERAFAQASDWRKSRDLTEFATALREKSESLDIEPRERIAAWCDWIEKAASNLDMVEHAGHLITFNDDRDQFWQPPNPGLRFR